jgi:hydrogenase maturation protein HypF
VIGVAFDGTGFGADGTIWGGEFLLADLAGYRRVGHLEQVPLPGGAAAIRQPWRMAVSYVDRAFGDTPPDLGVLERNASWSSVARLARGELNAPVTSSAGRLFDAVAALLGVRNAVNYEGQAAIELEQHADLAHRGSYPLAVAPGDVLTLGGVELFRAVAEDLASGTATPVVAARFHNAVVDGIVRACEALRDMHDVTTVALSGGVFQNLLLLSRTVDRLTDRHFRVLTHSRVPCNDGGISLGQAVVAAARGRAGV